MKLEILCPNCHSIQMFDPPEHVQTAGQLGLLNCGNCNQLISFKLTIKIKVSEIVSVDYKFAKPE